jgi:S1-C subfamily serine protease
MNKLISLFIMMMCTALASYSQTKQVTVNITVESDGYRTRIDTTFEVNDEDEVDDIINYLIKEKSQENDKLEKVIIIRDKDNAYTHVKTKPIKKSKAMMGVYLETNGHDNGVKVTSVVNGGAAQEAGMRGGDVIVEIGGDDIDDFHDLVEAKEDYEPGDKMEVVYRRGNERRRTVLTLSGEHKSTYNYTYSHSDSDSNPNCEKPFLGVYTDELSSSQARDLGLTSQQGVYIDGTIPYSGAARGGIQKGDVITHVDDRPLDASWELGDALREHCPGDEITLSYFRDGRACKAQVQLTDRQTVEDRKPKKIKVVTQKAFLGVNLENSGDGVRITGVVDNSAAEAAGLERGDIITGIGKYNTDNYAELGDAMKEFEPGERVRVRFTRDGRAQSTTAILGSKSIEKWVEVSGDQENENNEPREDAFDLDRVIDNFEDRATGQQVRSYMLNPTLEMDLFDFYPNPNDGRFTLQFRPNERGDLQIRIYSAEGREVYQEFIRDFSGEYNKEINISRNAPKGVYFLQLTQGDRGMVKRIIVK